MKPETRKKKSSEIEAAAQLLLKAGILELWNDDQGKSNLLLHPVKGRRLAESIESSRRTAKRPPAKRKAEDGSGYA